MYNTLLPLIIVNRWIRTKLVQIRTMTETGKETETETETEMGRDGGRQRRM